MRQPHWDAPGAPASIALPKPATPAARPRLTELPRTPAASYAELVALDGAHSIRAASARIGRPLERVEELDLQVLALLLALGHALSSQLHRHFNRGRAATTTQRRLKRLADAQLVTRLQFHRRDGGGMPMCYAIAAEGRRLLAAHEPSARTLAESDPELPPGGAALGGPVRQLAQARHDVHVAGWALALAELLASGVTPGPERGSRGRRTRLEGGEQIATTAPRTGTARVRALAPEDLRLPGGRVPHDFLRTLASGHRVEAERFETVRPHTRLSCPPHGELPRLDVLIEKDDRHESLAWVSKLERYDHFLSGWALHTRRYSAGNPLPLVVFLCRDRARAAACARTADTVLVACRAYAGEYPPDWEYCGRRQILFAAERDIHERASGALGVAPLPPGVRAQLAHSSTAPDETSPQLVVRSIV